MGHEPIFSWDEELGFASCILTDGENTYYGHAQCCPEDDEFRSEKTGCQIALHRACISMYKHYRDILKIKLSALNQYYYSIVQSKQFDSESYEVRMLLRQISMIKTDLATAKKMIADEKQSLKEYLSLKAELHTKIRRNRSKAKIQ